MINNSETKKLIISRYDNKQNLFYLRSPENESEILALSCNIILKGNVNGVDRFVKTDLDQSNYEVYRFVNPYLNAQNDMFELQLKIGSEKRNIGYIIPSNALENSNDETEFEFDELKQAYKFYCIKYIIENYSFADSQFSDSLFFNDLIDPDSIYLIIYKPLLIDPNFKIGFSFPNLALYGYYHYPNDSKANILSYTKNLKLASELEELIRNRFHTLREKGIVKISVSKTVLEKSVIGRLIYEKLLVETDNPLHRFLLLYQLIEYLIDISIRNEINKIFSERNLLSNRNILDKINEKSSTRSRINSLFNEISFAEINEIKNVLRDFNAEYELNYEKDSCGDCFYDVRNLLFHNYKIVLEKNPESDLTGLIIQCERLIHFLLISLK